MSLRFPAAALAVSVVTRSLPAVAEPIEADDATQDLPQGEPEKEPADWALVAEVGLAGIAPGMAGIGALSPMLGGGLERRLVDATWLMVDAHGAWNHAHDAWANSEATSVLASLGIRHAFTSPDIVEVSLYGAIDGHYARAGNETGDTHRGWGLGLSGGLVLDKQLNDWFGLRFRAALLSGGYQRSQWGPTRNESSDAWHATLRLDPTFGVRVLF